MIEGTVTRRGFAKALSAAGAALALPTVLVRQAQAADTFREGLQIGAWRRGGCACPRRSETIGPIHRAGINVEFDYVAMFD